MGVPSSSQDFQPTETTLDMSLVLATETVKLSGAKTQVMEYLFGPHNRINSQSFATTRLTLFQSSVECTCISDLHRESLLMTFHCQR